MEIASEDDEQISQALLEWSGLEDLWLKHDLEGLFDFATDIAFRCRLITKKTREWSVAPGHGGTTFTVNTRNPDALRAEMLARVEGLLQSHADEITDHQVVVRNNARARAERIAAGPELEVTERADHVSLLVRQFAPDRVHALSVSL